MTGKWLKEIKEIPGDDGWWKNASELKYCVTFEYLVDVLQMKEEKAIELLSDLYWAAAACYGA